MQAKLTERQLLCEKNHEMTLVIYGDSLRDVTGKLFQAMRKKVFQDIPYPIIHLEAKQVYFEKVDMQRTKERFMLFFWPRERVSYTVTAKIIVAIKYLNITEEEL